MELKTERQGNTLNLRLSGAINQQAAEELKGALLNLPLQQVEEVNLNLAGVTYIGSAGVGKLLLLYKNLPSRSARINLLQVPGDIYDLLLDMELEEIFHIQRG